MADATGFDPRRLLQGGLVALLADFVAAEAMAQDATITEPGAYRILLENDQVRRWSTQSDRWSSCYSRCR